MQSDWLSDEGWMPVISLPGVGKPGSDQIRSNSDRINNKIRAKSGHRKSQGQQLRLLPTFAGVLKEKVRTRTSFNKILTNYTSEDSLINVVYDKKYSLTEFPFSKCQDGSGKT